MIPGFLAGAAVCGLLCLGCYFLGYRRAARRYDIIVEVPTISAKDIPGLGAAMVEVKGVARVDQPLISDLARLPCVAFESNVTEHWTTTRIEHDSKGRLRTVTKHHSSTRYQNSGQTAFQIHDAGGQVTVQPEGASIDMQNGLELTGITSPRPESPAYGISPHHIGGSLSYREGLVPVEQETYVLGQVSEEHEIIAPRIVDRPFIISYRSEDSLIRRALWGKRVFGFLTLMLFLAGFVLLSVGLGLIDVGA
jgi:hypothetical protein